MTTIPRNQRRRQIGRALSAIVREFDRRAAIDADLDAFYAPGECYEFTHHYDHISMRRARKLACAIAGLNWRGLRAEARRVCPTIDAVLHRRVGTGVI